MTHRALVLWLILVPSMLDAAAPMPVLRLLHATQDRSAASLRIDAAKRSPYPIPRELTGKFAEHLGANIYQGMDAEILRNPTFADYAFWNSTMTPDGVAQFFTGARQINQALRHQATRDGWPGGELEALVAARADGLACFWDRVGPRAEVDVNPDTGPFGARAQRVQVRRAGQGIAQWCYLPLPRVRTYDVAILARSPGLTSLSVTLSTGTPPAVASRAGLVTTRLPSLAQRWKTFHGTLELPPDSPADAAWRLSVTAEAPGQFVMSHVFLLPADNVLGADPDIIRLLKQSHLPLLRWPGGNFASTYHWRDGVGPVGQRPTKPNFAWGGVEPNLFGTDEFIAFCRAVGCEPMICINAGSGTPEEAAQWIQYCNGPADSRMGALRATNGHAAPYHVMRWEVGNELWGRWQDGWTSAAGYVDRYKRFFKAMHAADPRIRLYACGAPVLWGKPWNDTLIAGAAPILRAITDHPLIGGTISPSIAPLDVFRDFMAVPEVLEQRWAGLRTDMLRAGIRQPRLAITELQMFAHLRRLPDAAPARLTAETLVNPGTLAEALYDVLIYHAAVRLAPFVELVTHSAVVNHGGGLRKEHQRVYANPCFYAQSAFAAFAGATPVALQLDTPIERAPLVLPDLKRAVREAAFGDIDALAALATNGDLLVSIVDRVASGTIHLTVEIQNFQPSTPATVWTLTGGHPWAANTLEHPRVVVPVASTVAVRGNRLAFDLQPFTVMQVRLHPRRAG